MKRITVLITTLLALVLVISGCSSGGKSSTPDTTTTPIAATANTSIITPKTSTSTLGMTTPTNTIATELDGIIARAALISSYKCDLVATYISTNDSKMDMTMNGTVWYRKPRMLIEVTVVKPLSDYTSVSISDGTGDVIQWVKGQPTAIRVTGLQNRTMSPNEKAAISEFLGDKIWNELLSIKSYAPVVLGNETYDGKMCLVVQYTPPGFLSGKDWLWKERGLSIKNELVTPYFKMTTECKNVDFSDVPDSMVTLPAYVKLQTANVAESHKTLGDILAKAKKVVSVKYAWEMEYFSGGISIPVDPSGTGWVKGNKWIKAPTGKLPGYKVWTVWDLDAKTATIHSTGPSGRGMVQEVQLPFSGVTYDCPAYLLLSNSADLFVGASETVLGTESVDGKICSVLQYDGQGVSTKVWIWQEYGLVIRWESSIGMSASTTETNKINFSNFDFSDIPDSMFK